MTKKDTGIIILFFVVILAFFSYTIYLKRQNDLLLSAVGRISEKIKKLEAQDLRQQIIDMKSENINLRSHVMTIESENINLGEQLKECEAKSQSAPSVSKPQVSGSKGNKGFLFKKER